MATGIEMLGQMGTDQSLAGPVQGGNMVVKPNRVPVGGATMLSKALRKQADKGVGGMYLLPEQRDQTPDFMKMAQMNVKREMANRRNQYPMNYAENEGGIIPMLPRNLKTAPGADETTLAYITPEEQAVLGLLNPGTPHTGPEQVPTYDSQDYGVYTSSEDWASFDTGTGSAPQAHKEAQQEALTDTSSQYHQQAVEEQNIIDKYGDTYNAFNQAAQDEVAGTFNPETGETTEVTTKVSESQSNDLKDLADAITNDNQEKAKEIIEKRKEDMNFFQTLKTMYGDTLGAGINKVAEWGSGIFSKKEKDGKDGKKRKRTAGEFIDNLFTGGIFTGIMKGLSDPKAEQFTDENYLAIMQDVFKKQGGFEGKRFEDFMKEHAGVIKEGMEPYQRGQEEITFEDLMKRKYIPETGSGLEKRLNPEKYWSEFKGGGTMGDMEDLAGLDAQANPDIAQKIFEAREIIGRQKDAQDRRQGGRPGGMGGGAGPVIEDEVTEAIVEEGATTMPYTGPRTGGAEVNVPLSRRFALDPTQQVAQYKTAPRSAEDIYKYYTEGTTGEGLSLEPYGEFQRRRRKALGKEPLGFWSY